jgi:hypothetical protein
MYGLAILLIVVVGIVLLAWVLAKLWGPAVKKERQGSIGAQEKRPKKSSKRWIVYLVIALVLSLWSGLIALLFLVFMAIILQNPKGEINFAVSKEEKSTARRVYTWLFISSIFTVPLLIFLLFETYSQSLSNNELVLTALVPALLHLPLLLGLSSKSIFVYRHSQQGLLLSALRAVVAAVAVSIGDYPYEGIWLFLLGNGSLWLFGCIWGWVEVNRGECWWLKQRGDVIAVSSESIRSPKIEHHSKLSPEQNLEYSKWFLKRQLKNSAKEYALEAFRSGDYEIRRQAVRVLDDLNEVEFF